MKHSSLIQLIAAVTILLVSCGGEKGHNDWPTPDPTPDPTPTMTEKPRYIWVDAAANFPEFANSKENISRDLANAKNAGFTDIVVDVRPTTGDVLFKTSQVDEVQYLYAWVNGVYSKVDRTATWDYLQAFIDEGHKLGLKIHAGINTFVGGRYVKGIGMGLFYRNAEKAKNWATVLNAEGGLRSIMDDNSNTEKFMNPANPEVQEFLCGILKDLAKYNVDGIVLDRGRYCGLQGDFSDLSRSEFEAFVGAKVKNFPSDILAPGTTKLPATYPPFMTKWLEFRVKTICEFMKKAREAVKSVNSTIKFGVYVGGWYSTYYDVGVNWADNVYDPSAQYKWATSTYKNYGYAGYMDHMLIGAYASPKNINGTGEWTMEGFCLQAKAKTKNGCKLVVGGPDVGNWDSSNTVSQDDKNAAVTKSVMACINACDGYFLFDMVHLRQASQWSYVKAGIDAYLESIKKK
ncbi:MAG: family 10 glycosylhydrolase [Bacteroidales bacterium]|nr:family 10 glycosylhydrolase [Candidatus Sodaliphilus fimicaballi]